MDDAIPAVVELVLDKAFEYVQIDSLPLTPGHVKKRLKKFFHGWHVTVSISVFLAVVVLITNVVLLIWASCRNLTPGSGDILQVFRGNCSKMQNIFTWSHVGINILSTLLLAASNSACQVLSAPTRKEINIAHAQGIWLDVGVPSFRNLRHIALKRVVIYFLLALSSVPLHLIYNSVIFPTTSTNNNIAAIVEERFLQGAPWNSTGKGLYMLGSGVNSTVASNTFAQMQQDQHSLVHLSKTSCVQQFSSQFISQYSNFLIVAENPGQSNSTNSFIQYNFKQSISSGIATAPALAWLCESSSSHYQCHSTLAQKDPEKDFVMYARNQPVLRVKYCLAESVTPHCSISMSRSLLVAVIVCNCIKVISFLMVVKWAGDRSLVTVGDAISSFLSEPDLSTRDMGPLSAMDVRNEAWGRRTTLKTHEHFRPWPAKRHLWFAAAGWRRWTAALTCYLIFFLPATVLPWLSTTISGFGSIRNLGNLNPNLVLTFTLHWSLTANVLFLNLPQLIISFCYLFYNAVLTGSLLASEYSDFGRQRKALRVTANSKSQRSTYWLQIPYRYAIPLMVVWIVLHWLVSQSIFLARVTVYGDFWHIHEEYKSLAITGCGWSPIPVLMAVVLGGLILLAFILMGFRRYPDNVPIVATCTAAMAAACHASAHEGKDMMHKPLMYGVLKSSLYADELEKVQRVGFSADDVEPLVKGQIYR